MAFYDEMAEIAQELITEFNQGTVQIVRSATVVADPARPWDIEKPASVSYDVPGVARTVERKYVDDTVVVGSEVQVTVPAPSLSFEPNFSDRVSLDGKIMTTVKFMRIPESGTPIAYVFIVRR